MSVPNPYRALKDFLLATPIEELTKENVEANARTFFSRFDEGAYREYLEEAALAIGAIYGDKAKSNHLLQNVCRRGSQAASFANDVAGVIMPEYIKTLARLEDVKLADLGPMIGKPYDAFISAAEDAAKKAGVAQAKLIIGLKFKLGAHPMGLDDHPYLINADEWDRFLLESAMLCELTPHVYVVDGEKYSALI